MEETETENEEQSYTDLGFSPSEGIVSSVGSTEAVDMHEPTSLEIQISPDLPESVTKNASVEENYSTVAQHGSVDQESSTLPVDFVEENDQLEDEGQFQDAEFVDAPEELSMSDARSVENGESAFYVEPHEEPEESVEDGKHVRQLTYELALLQASLEKTTADKEILAQTYKEEKEMIGRELYNLQWQLATMANQQLYRNDNGRGLVDRLRQDEKEEKEVEIYASDTPLQLMIADCSKSIAVLKRGLEEQLQAEGTIREIHAVLFTKDQEIENLSAKYNLFLSEIDQLRQCLTEVVPEMKMPENAEYGAVFDMVRRELLDHKRIENGFIEKLTQVEIENNKLLEQLHMAKERIDVTSGEVKKLKMEVEQEKNRSSTTKEKLQMAVTKGKGLVQQRDSLKHLLAEKSTEVDTLNQLLTERTAEVDSLNQILSGKMTEIDSLNQLLTEKTTEVDSLNQLLTEKMTEIDSLSQLLTEKTTELDSLNELLTAKTTDLENCLLELQEKSNVLVSAEMQNEELVRVQTLVDSLRDSLSKRTATLEEVEGILSQIDMPNGLHSMDTIERVRWLADQKSELQGISLEYNKLKSSVSSFKLPELVASSTLESQISWLRESLSIAEDNVNKLQGEFISSEIAVASLRSELSEAVNEIDQLKTSISTEKREKDSLQMGLEALSSKYEGIVEREFQGTSERDRMAKLFLEACGEEDQDEFHEPYSDMARFVEYCVGRIKEKVTTAHLESLNIGTEQFEWIQSLLYLRDQELVLCKDILEEDMLNRSDAATIANELKKVTEEIILMKDVKESMQKELERSDEKCALLREKLSMAVKKGKGLVQEREVLKKSLDEKSAEIEKLQLELQQQESLVNECRDQINGLSRDMEHVSKLESDLLATKDQNVQLERYLLESNSVLERVVDSIESVVLPVDNVFEEPVDKVKWIADCLNEYQIGKLNAEQELEKVKEEVHSVSEKLADARATITSLENDILEAKNSNLVVVEEKKAIETAMTYLKEELENVKGEAGSHGSKFIEACASIKSLEDELSRAERNISVLEQEKSAACLDKSCAEKELEKVKEEAHSVSELLAEARATITSLEDTVLEAKNSSLVVVEEKKAIETAMTHLKQELEDVKGEAGSHGSKFIEACASIKSLEDELSRVDKNISVLEQEKSAALFDKSCAEKELEKAKEKAGDQTSKAEEAYATIKSLEGRLSQLEESVSVLTEEKNIAQSGMASLEKELEKAKSEASSQADRLVDVHATVKLLEDAVSAAESNVVVLTSEKKNAEIEIETLNAKLSASMAELAGTHGSLESQSVELFHQLNNLKVLMNDDNLLSSLTQLFKRKTEGLRDMNSLLENIRDQFVERGSEQLTTAGTEKDPHKSTIFSAYLDKFANGTMYNIEATDHDDILLYLTNIVEGFSQKNKLIETKIEDFSRNMDELISVLLRSITSTRDHIIDILEPIESLKLNAKNHEAYKQTIESSMITVKNHMSKLLSEWYDGAQNMGFHMDIGDLQDENEYGEAAENVGREVVNFIKKLEKVKKFTLSNLEELQNQLLDVQLTSENAVKERDFSQSRISTLEKECETIQDLCNKLKIKVQEYEARDDTLKEKDTELSSLQHSLAMKEQETEELESSLSVQVDEVKRLKTEAESLLTINQDFEKTKSDMSEIKMDLERLVQRFGGNDYFEDKKSSVKGMITILDNLITASIRECDTSKLNTQESSAKLLENQKIVSDLSEKIKLLEDSIHKEPTLPDSVQERSVPLLQTASEISEIEDVASVARNSVSPVVPSAALRTMRKGSTDHLVLTIDSESDRLISPEEIDDDKGHVFKSLNTSGLVPKQGKLVADRVDGIWVSGGRALMSRPRARIGVLAYCLLLHLWVLGTIL
ncbi:hypothetical protein ACHQM5_010820 [Ranunculus cassubicifolius]